MGPSGKNEPRRRFCEEEGGRRDWSRSATDPAVPISKRYSPAVTGPGLKEISCELGPVPRTSAPEMRASASTDMRCWGIRPGFGRFLRMLKIRTGFPVMQDRLRVVRRICPPPSPKLPSISTNSVKRPLSAREPRRRYTRPEGPPLPRGIRRPVRKPQGQTRGFPPGTP